MWSKDLGKQVKQLLKPGYFKGRRRFAQTFYGYDSKQLAASLRQLGINNGDCLLVHSGFARDSGFKGSAGDVLETFIDVLGADGHLLMMSMPYGGSSERYAASDPLFDVTKSPSVLGVLPEIFRRRGDVERSLNPLHPVLARGPLAAWLTADHDVSNYSCGKGSPFERFLNLDGKLLFFDAPYNAMTFMHYVEDFYQDRLPVPLYADEAVTLRVKDHNGKERALRQFFFSAKARERRHFAPIEAQLMESGAMKTARLGRSRLLCVPAQAVCDCAGELLEHGHGFYR